LRILIAQDEAVIAMLPGEVPGSLGHNICASVTTADEAVAAALLHKFDLIIIDTGLRDSRGAGAITTIMTSTPARQFSSAALMPPFWCSAPERSSLKNHLVKLRLLLL
jgi:CheY-like chemotaxis protein